MKKNIIANTKKEGERAERLAEHFLTTKGLRKLARNYNCRFGEIDLIMQDGDSIVFIEVRARKSCQYGGAIASITYGKQQKIIHAARHFLMVKNIAEKYPLRFDVVSFDGEPPKLNWIKDAFSVN
ncbi:YraN family protein [Legionella israelensis]|uniref:YraN family protein n=1 Tax=Legionella israelensis TaxID=454 RepID=UPI001FD72B85|nr:YraN family protein [Legionella israelensis]